MWRRRSKSPRGTRLLFATDIHASERCWLKFVNGAAFYDADILVMGGDCTGKAVVPIVSDDESYRAEVFGTTHVVAREDIESFEKRLADAGLYYYRTSARELVEMQSGDAAAKIDELFLDLMIDRLTRWMKIADERLSPRGVRCYLALGNDDYPELERVLTDYSTEHVRPCGEQVIRITDEHEMLSVGFSNPTPWRTPRELPEDELRSHIDRLAKDVADMERCIFNIHVPPINTPIDLAPELDADLRPVARGGQVMMKSVGSVASRESIEQYQPLLALHGHIHESKGFVRLGRTPCVNPGSEYSDGILTGALVQLSGGEASFTLVSG